MGSHRQLGVTVMQILAGVGTAPVVAGAFESIATITVGSGGSSSETFSSIPGTYKHLQLRFITRSNGGAYNPTIRFNSDTGANYSWHYLDGTGASASSGSGTSDTSIILAALDATANTFQAGIIDILDYANTNKHKTIRVFEGVDRNGSGAIDLWSGSWRSTSAITTINLTFSSAQYSHYALYGIKG